MFLNMFSNPYMPIFPNYGMLNNNPYMAMPFPNFFSGSMPTFVPAYTPIFNFSFDFPKFDFNQNIFSTKSDKNKYEKYGMPDYSKRFAEKTSNRAQRALELARSQIGVKEIGTSNDSTEIRKYKNSSKDNLPWCASFASWLYGRGQGTNNSDTFGYTASSQEIMRRAGSHFASKNSNYVPKAGDLVIWTNSSNTAQGHVGIVDEVTSNGYYTIEGNTKDGVKRKFYSFNKQDISSNLKFSGFVKMNEWAA